MLENSTSDGIDIDTSQDNTENIIPYLLDNTCNDTKTYTSQETTYCTTQSSPAGNNNPQNSHEYKI